MAGHQKDQAPAGSRVRPTLRRTKGMAVGTLRATAHRSTLDRTSDRDQALTGRGHAKGVQRRPWRGLPIGPRGPEAGGRVIVALLALQVRTTRLDCITRTVLGIPIHIGRPAPGRCVRTPGVRGTAGGEAREWDDRSGAVRSGHDGSERRPAPGHDRRQATTGARPRPAPATAATPRRGHAKGVQPGLPRGPSRARGGGGGGATERSGARRRRARMPRRWGLARTASPCRETRLLGVAEALAAWGEGAHG
jgi:hypothetical protein